MTVEEFRLALKINVRRADSCLEWQGKLHSAGYPKIYVVLHGQLYRLGHRAALALRLGRPLGRFEYATHACDNKRCVADHHIRLGTPKSNFHESMQRSGLARPALSIADAQKIRLLYDAGAGTQYDLAADFGVSQGVIRKVVHYEPPYWR